ncbi:10492_t:CDS:1, partial [Acaulospora morrowiae]
FYTPYPQHKNDENDYKKKYELLKNEHKKLKHSFNQLKEKCIKYETFIDSIIEFIKNENLSKSNQLNIPINDEFSTTKDNYTSSDEDLFTVENEPIFDSNKQNKSDLDGYNQQNEIDNFIENSQIIQTKFSIENEHQTFNQFNNSTNKSFIDEYMTNNLFTIENGLGFNIDNQQNEINNFIE